MKKVQLIVGHKEIKKGAGNWTGMTEWNFNKKLVEDIFYKLSEEYDILSDIVFRESTYKNMVDSINCHLAIEFHLNAYEEQMGEKEATGTEMLVAERVYDTDTQLYIAELSQSIADTIDIKDRGLKERKPNTRGYYFLKNADVELAIIAETAFIDNISDMAKLLTNYNDVVGIYARWISDYCKE